MSDLQPENFITVVSVGPKLGHSVEDGNGESDIPGYVTVLTIGDAENNNKLVKDVTEEVIVYRLPGERLGFGLKFEGGIKANEFVERLFIQSCAADSPASHVKSSWGKLTEGDEVLEIDSIPVKTMTRVDCVRCLKDSNVAIKLLVRHVFEDQTKPKEDPPSVVSTEEKRIPPPPPPVPPRKIPRKLIKNPNGNLPVMTNGTKEPQQPEPSKSKKLQSPRSSGRYYSPDVPRRDRRFSDGSLGPPDAEVYVDLFLQESTQSLSESDDTGSTISTVIDRFGSFPTTTTSSFSGSLPSTPTAVQRHLDISNISIYEDEDISLANTTNNDKPSLVNREENNNNIVLDEGSPLCFQDAPLSYGNESTKYLVPEEIEETPVATEESKQCYKKPPVPPRSKDLTVSIDKHKDNKKSENLPRLVDFVPKSNGVKENSENPAEIIKLFLENERRRTNCDDFETNDNDNIDNIDAYSNNMDMYTSKWNMSSQLATIGEVEEELSGSDFNSFNRPSVKSTPVVIVENADVSNDNDKCHNEITTRDQTGADGSMATPPSDSRQPPDGDEFPDFVETKEVILIKPPVKKYFKPTPSEQLVALEDSKSTNLNLSQVSSSSDLSKPTFEPADDIPEPTPLHTRSQSLIDMSTLSKEKNARWNQIVEQRRKGLSKLKGLVIPEATENDVAAPQPINIPEIKSINTAILFSVPKVDNSYNIPQGFQPPETKYPLVIPPLVSNTTNNLPKYSPAFKRKSLQVYPTSISKNDSSENVITEITKNCDKSSSPRSSKISDDDLNPPKSLESISSPTRSDCSFDYVSSTKKYNKETSESFPKTHATRLEDESDNDSAVSSSQSSYNSRFSPPPSPTRTCEMNHEDDKNSQNRLLKASSVEAINRKNILASAKCRSGKDLKIGSPVIRRKDENKEEERPTTNGQSTPPEAETVDEEKIETRVWETVEAAVVVNNDDDDTKTDSLSTVSTEEKEEIVLRSTAKVPENAPSPVKSITRSTSASNCLPTTPVRLTKSPPEPRDIRQSTPNNLNSRPYTSVLNRKATPINVKALTQNFENFGSSPPPLPQKVPAFKSQMVMRNVKAEILKTESKILSNGESAAKQIPKPEVKPKPRESVAPLKLDKRDDLLKTSRLSFSTDTVVLRLDTLGGSLGITLAGGVDESKEITIHRIRYGSIAYHDGRLKRGDKVISINGRATKGLTHSESGDLLKEPVIEFTFEIQEGIETVPSTPSSLSSRRSSSMSVLTEIKSPIIESAPRVATNVVAFIKDGSGLGFSIEGGKESPQGDVPLVVKKIFTGGAADKHGELRIGDEILRMNDISFLNLTRIEAWNLMKKIPDGMVNIHIYRKC